MAHIIYEKILKIKYQVNLHEGKQFKTKVKKLEVPDVKF